MEERFWSKVQKDSISSCWLWTASKNKNGYGKFTIYDAISESAHRVAYRLSKGEIPDGSVIRQTCKIPSCVNPEHLQLGTRK